MRRLVVLFVALVGTLTVSSGPAGAGEIEIRPAQTTQEELRGCVKWDRPADPQPGDTWQHSFACVSEDTDDFSGEMEDRQQAQANIGTVSCERRVNASGTAYDYCPGDTNWTPVPLGTIRLDGDSLVVQSDVLGCWIDVRWALDAEDSRADDGPVRRGRYITGDVTAAAGTVCGHVIEPTDLIDGDYRYNDDSFFLVTP